MRNICIEYEEQIINIYFFSVKRRCNYKEDNRQSKKYSVEKCKEVAFFLVARPLWPNPPPLKLSGNLFWEFFLELQQTFFFLIGMALIPPPPPPLSGWATEKNAVSLNNLYKILTISMRTLFYSQSIEYNRDCYLLLKILIT